jgi:hypothetical protein
VVERTGSSGPLLKIARNCLKIKRLYDINILCIKKEEEYNGVEYKEDRYEKKKKKRKPGQEEEDHNVKNVYAGFRDTSGEKRIIKPAWGIP